MIFPAEQPIVTIGDLRLRPLKINDDKDLYAYFSKDEVTEFYDLFTFKSTDEATQLIQTWIERTVLKQGIRWAITYKEEDKLVGTCGFHNLSEENNRAEIGYDLHPDLWGKGYMTQIVSFLIEYGFKNMNLHRVEAFIDPSHHASRKVLTKNGMQTEGILRDYFFEKGRFVDAEMIAILNK
ncbi:MULTISPECIES: GNAT family N-acetyltransferase [Myroides]|uniref:GNAT family N-acetyltransferase n=1 Tax=Myroides albus TaxID=2562892 RepID=A0A6I3LTY0_9FLAO|nr:MULTISPECIES: GNAT family N-acetyltransferase [Myroides]MTG99402.1 GNAT family N-acetyltransferase [Myroides albus]MVX37223.1 GNAT family N-acetyltransferase [Myroides sp. LoEW2-1]UVD80161.1 GNAT family N-acetyltransferase [Myroides albus]